MMSRRSAGLLMVALIFTAAPAAAQTITWQMANEYPATSIHGEGDQFFARELSERSSGRIAITHSFDAINDELRSQYVISYRPADFDADGRFRSIEISALKKDLQVRARKGYFAPQR